MLLNAFLLATVWTQAIETGNEMLKAGHFAEAEKQYYLALSQIEREAAHSPELAATYNNLASAYQELGRDADAERLYLRSIRLWQSIATLPDAPAKPLNNLGTLYRKAKRFTEAERCYRQSLDLRIQAHGPDHPDVARVMNNLGRVAHLRGRYDEAADLYRRALEILERNREVEEEIAHALSNIGSLLHDRRQDEEARRTLQRARDTALAVFGPDHPTLINILVNSAAVELALKQYARAESLLRWAKEIAENRLGGANPVTASIFAAYAVVLRKLDRKPEAILLERRADEVLRSYSGSHTVDVSELTRVR